MDWIKNPTVRLVACIVMIVSVLILHFGGVTPETIQALITEAIALISAVVTFIQHILDAIAPKK